jgi:hypothetical protein
MTTIAERPAGMDASRGDGETGGRMQNPRVGRDMLPRMIAAGSRVTIVAFGLVAGLVGCGPPRPPAAPTTPAPECMQLPDAVKTAMPAAPADYTAALGNVVFLRCTADQWPEAPRRCIGSAHSSADLQACQAKLTPAQRAGLAHDSDAAIHALQPPEPEPSSDLEPPDQHVPKDELSTGAGAPPPPTAPAAQPSADAPKAKKAPSREADPCAGGK